MNFNNINMNDMEKMMKMMEMFKLMQDVFGNNPKETNVNNEINQEVEKNEVNEPVISKKVDLIDTLFDEEKNWENVLENRESVNRWCKKYGKKATEADKDYILKKLNGGKPMSDEDIDNVLKGIFPNDK